MTKQESLDRQTHVKHTWTLPSALSPSLVERCTHYYWVSVNRGGRGGHPVKIQKWAKSNFYYCVGGKWPKRPKIAKLVTVKVGR